MGDNITVKQKPHIKFDYFGKALALWLSGIGANILPVLYKMIKTWFDVQTDFDWQLILFGNIDFVSIVFGAAFLLLVEMSCFEPKRGIVKSVITILSLLITIFLLITYTILAFANNWYTRISTNFVAKINLILFVLVIIMGIIYFLFSSIERQKEVIENA